MTASAVDACVARQSPAAATVYETIREREPIDQTALVEATVYSRRHVQTAVAELEGCGAIEARRDPHDPRRRRYSLADAVRAVDGDE